MKKRMLPLIFVFGFSSLASSVPAEGTLPIRCSFNMESQSIWSKDTWGLLNATFLDRSADWISPTEPLVDRPGCSPLPSGQRALFVTAFAIPQRKLSHFEFLADNSARLSLFRVDSGEIVYSFASQKSSSYQSKMLTLDAGIYALAIDVTDFGIASGMTASVKTSSSDVIRNTGEHDHWAIALLTEGQKTNADLVQRLLSNLPR